MRKFVIKTKRLLIKLMNEDEILKLIDLTLDIELKASYTEMHDLAVANKADWAWYAPWCIYKKRDGNAIGSLCFKGPCKNDAVEVGYGIETDFQNNGYATEAVDAFINWAFDKSDIWYVEAEPEPDNFASRRVLEKLGFSEDAYGIEGPRFSLKRRPYPVIASFMLLFFSCGLSIGLVMDRMSLGMSLGLFAGFVIGSLIDRIEKNKMNDAEKKRRDRLSIKLN